MHQDALPVTASSAVSVRSSDRAQTQALTSSSLGAMTATFCRLRKLFTKLVSSSVATITTGDCRPEPSRKARADLVDGASKSFAETTASDPSLTWLASADRRAALA